MTTTPKELVELRDQMRREAEDWRHNAYSRATLAYLAASPALSRFQTVDREAKAREAVNALDWVAVYNAARKRSMADVTGTFYDEHLAREVAERVARALLHPIDDISETGGGV